MHFSTSLTTLLATTASALTLPNLHSRTPLASALGNEPISISSYSLRKINSTIQSVSFDISSAAKNVSCSTTQPIPLLPSSIFPCAGEPVGSGFRFSLSEVPAAGNATEGVVPQDPNQYRLTVWDGSGNSGKWGWGVVPTYCHAGGLGQTDFICVQVPIGEKYEISLRG